MNRKPREDVGQWLRTGFVAFAVSAGSLHAAGQASHDSPTDSAPITQSSSGPSSNPGATAEVSPLPDSPGMVVAQSQSAAPPTSPSHQTNQTPASPSDNASSRPQQDAQTEPGSVHQRPVGTAAAEAPKKSGVAASQPAGVAIAPAKQRRVRTIVLKTGAILGACAAVGTVVALSAGTSSKPPGAH